RREAVTAAAVGRDDLDVRAVLGEQEIDVGARQAAFARHALAEDNGARRIKGGHAHPLPFSGRSQSGALANAPPRGRPPNEFTTVQMSKYSANSYGCGRSRIASTSFSRLYQIHVLITSLVNTSPCSRNSWSFSRLFSAS